MGSISTYLPKSRTHLLKSPSFPSPSFALANSLKERPRSVMGRLNHDPCINHFSHPHPLELFNPAQSLHITSSCSACNLQPSGLMYTCKPCNFTLHISCTQMPTLITHPSHPIHPLTLFSTPVYPGGSFNCDGCGRQGNGFNYHCTTCDFDVHMMCATNPISVVHQSHPHQLNLTFFAPYQTKGFSCDICRKIGSNHWLYRCGACEFDAHMDCAMSVNIAPLTNFHHSNSLPAANNFNQYGQQQTGPAPGGVAHFMHSQSMGANLPTQQQQLGGYQQPINGGPDGAGNGTIMDAMVQGVVQSMFNPDANSSTGSNSGDPDGGGGSNSSLPSIISVGSSILSGVFGGESDNSQN